MSGLIVLNRKIERKVNKLFYLRYIKQNMLLM